VKAFWPIPRILSSGNSSLRLSETFSIDIAFEPAAPLDLRHAIDRIGHYLFHDKLGRLVVGRGPGNISLESVPALQRLVLCLNSRVVEPQDLMLNYVPQSQRYIHSISDVVSLPVEERDESYTLDIPQDGSDASLVANTTLGLLRGLTTFSQIWYHYKEWTYTMEAPFRIVDEPHYVSICIRLFTDSRVTWLAEMARSIA
jgi:hexosaminidase